MKTRDRILQASLELFNERGERNVTTNHLAAHLGISPGNLYYHFNNKSEIIYQLFRDYEALVDGYLQVPGHRPLQVSDLVFYLESVVGGLWAYRFLHRDLAFLLEADPRLQAEYRAFTGRCLEAIGQAFDGLVAGGVLEPQDAGLKTALALNAWLVITNWMAFLKTLEPVSDDLGQRAREPRLRQVIYQVLTLMMPYLSERCYAEVQLIGERYRSPD